MTQEIISQPATTLKDPKSGNILDFYFEYVTPALATKLLKKNHPHNRNLNLGSVRSLAHQMQNDLWKTNGESIKISENGTLIDGQTRLRAIIMADKAVHLLICSGLEDLVFTTLDDGMSRTFAETLTCLDIHIKGGNGLASRVLTNMKILQRCFHSNTSYDACRSMERKSNADLLDFYYRLKDFDKVCVKFHSLFDKTKVNKLTPVSIILPLYYLFHDQNSEAVFNIIKSLETGQVFDDMSANSPMQHILTRIKSRKRLEQRISTEEYYNLFMIAYKGSFANLPMKKLEPSEIREWTFFNEFPNHKIVKRKLLTAR